MSNYSIVTNFVAKDSLISGNPAKLVKGADFTTEFTAVQTAINSKPDGSVQFFPDGTAAQPSIGFTNNAGTGVFQSSGALGFATGATSRFTLSAAGGLFAQGATGGDKGVGTINAANLYVNGTAVSTANLLASNNTFTGTNAFTLGATVSGGVFTSRGITDNATATALTLSSGGLVTLAVPAAGSTLTINGDTADSNDKLLITSAGVGASLGINSTAANGTYVRFLASSTAYSGLGAATRITSGAATDFAIATFGATNLFLGTNGVNRAKIFGNTGQAMVQIADSAGTLQNAGFLEVPQNAQNGPYTCVLADSGKHILNSSGSAGTYTIPANSSVAYPLGTVLTFATVGASTMTIAITTDTLVLAGVGTTGSRSLATNSVATALKVQSTQWVISGSGLT